MAAPDLNALPEPDRTQWIAWGLTGHNAEVEAERLNIEYNKSVSG